MQLEVAYVSDDMITNLIFWSYKLGLILEHIEHWERITKINYTFSFLGEIQNSN